MSLTPEQLGDFRAELERQLVRLERSMEISEENVQTVDLDQQAVGRLSRMDSLQNQHMSKNLQERENARYGAIKSALERLDKGTYGICVKCGEPLDPGRLFVMPEVDRCGACSG